jgi:hypothetical protein
VSKTLQNSFLALAISLPGLAQKPNPGPLIELGVQRSDPQSQVTLPPNLRPQPLVGGEPAPSRPKPPKHPKLSTVLADLARAVPQQRGPVPQGQKIAPLPSFSVDTLPKSVRDAVGAGMLRINKEAEVQVYISVTEVTDENLQQLQTVGARVELHDEQHRVVQAHVPVTRLEEVASLPFVRFVRPPNYGIRHTGSVTTQGDAILKADQVRSQFGVDGRGGRVGVISDGIAGVFATGCTTCGGLTGGPISTADLPDSTGTRNASGVLTTASGGITAKSFRTDGNLEPRLELHPGCTLFEGAEGTAMLEIVHDLAPGAKLFFANSDTSLQFNQAVNFLAANTDVAADDLGFFGLPYDGTSLVSSNTAAALNNNANPLRAYFTAVGNEARSHYQENFVDSGRDGTSIVGFPGDLHLFQATPSTSDVLGLGPSTGDAIFLCDTSGLGGVCKGKINPGSFDTAEIILEWNDPFGASKNDYDLFLIQSSTGRVVASSRDPQTGTQDPLEALIFTNNTGKDDFFRIVIQNSANRAAPRNFDMFILEVCGQVPLATTGEAHNYNTISSSVPAESDAGGSPVSVISVGAANWMTPDTIENFSSNGPTIDGRLKPDLIAVDGVSVTGAGGFPKSFFGTSAAAPHGAGVAALVLQSSPCLSAGSAGARTPADGRTILRNLLTNNAVPLGIPGPNNVFGFGRLDALAAASKTIPTANAGSNQTLSGTSPSGAGVTLNGTTSSDPNNCPLTFNWAGGCGSATAASPTVNCPLGNNTMTLTVTSNGVTLSSPSSVQLTVTDFTVGASPASVTVNKGQSASYTVTVNPKFGSFTNAIQLSCTGLPTLSSCTFSPASLTPGANATTSTLTISTTAPSGLIPSMRPPKLLPLYVLVAGFFLLYRRLLAPRTGRPRLVTSVILILLFALSTGLLSCGGGGGGGGGPRNPGTPSGSFGVTITGTAGSLQRSTMTTLLVQ